jgi:hypothetical protein
MLAGCGTPPAPPASTPTTGALVDAALSATLAPTATATPGGASIVSFTVTPAEAYPGDTVTLTWQTTGALGAEIDVLLPIDQYSAHYDALPPSGQLQVMLDESDRSKKTFILNVPTQGDPLKAQVDVKVLCSLNWFFAGGPAATCPQWPAGQHAGQGFAQKFEHGQIIWNGGDGFAVILYDDAEGGWERDYGDWSEGKPESDPALVPQAGLLQPVRHIGAVWRSEVLPGHPPRERLGWALAPEVALATNFQCDSDYFYYQQPETAPCFATGLDGAIVRLSGDAQANRSLWKILKPQ